MVNNETRKTIRVAMSSPIVKAIKFFCVAYFKPYTSEPNTKSLGLLYTCHKSVIDTAVKSPDATIKNIVRANLMGFGNIIHAQRLVSYRDHNL